MGHAQDGGLRGESRSRYLLTTFAAIAVVLAVGLLVTFVIGVVGAALAATIAGIGLDGIRDTAAIGRLPELFVRGWVAITATAALGFAVATLARSQLAGIGVGIAFAIRPCYINPRTTLNEVVGLARVVREIGDQLSGARSPD